MRGAHPLESPVSVGGVHPEIGAPRLNFRHLRKQWVKLAGGGDKMRLSEEWGLWLEWLHGSGASVPIQKMQFVVESSLVILYQKCPRQSENRQVIVTGSTG